MLSHFFAPLAGLGELILRLTLAITFLPHGLSKLQKPSGFIGLLRQLHVPAAPLMAWIVMLLESVGALLLILGVLTRLVALGLAGNMVVAILSARLGMAKAPFMSTAQAPGWELDFVLLGGALTLVFTGSGRASIDSLLGL